MAAGLRARALCRKVGRGIEQRARDARLVAGAAAPGPVIADAAAWLRASGPAAGRLVQVPAEYPASHPARTVGAEHPLFRQVMAEGPRRRAAFALELPGARLAGAGGCVVAASGELLLETAWDEQQARASGLIGGHRLPPALAVPGACASLVTMWSENYYHWLLEGLGRLAVLEQAGLGGLPLIVPERLRGFQSASLDLLGIGPERRIAFTREHVAPETLVWASAPGHTGHLQPWAAAWLRERLTAAAGAGPRRDRLLYVSRNGMSRSTARRQVTNEDAVLAALEPLGFELVVPERLTFAEQVQLFAEAAVIAGPHGAAHTNALFARDATIIELFEPGYVNPCQHGLATAAGHAYWYLVGDSAGNNDIRVPIEALRQTLAAAGVA